MNSKPYFRVELTEEDQIHVECDGSGQELMNLFANVINDNPDIAAKQQFPGEYGFAGGCGNSWHHVEQFSGRHGGFSCV